MKKGEELGNLQSKRRWCMWVVFAPVSDLQYMDIIFSCLTCIRSYEFESRWWRGAPVTTLCNKGCQWLATGWIFTGDGMIALCSKTYICFGVDQHAELDFIVPTNLNGSSWMLLHPLSWFQADLTLLFFPLCCMRSREAANNSFQSLVWPDRTYHLLNSSRTREPLHYGGWFTRIYTTKYD